MRHHERTAPAQRTQSTRLSARLNPRNLTPVRPMTKIFLIAAIVNFTAIGCGGPAVLNSPEAAASADALYTAITSHREDLVADVESRLSALLTAGKLSQDANRELAGIIMQARQGKWQQAAEALDAFIRFQPPQHDQHSH